MKRGWIIGIFVFFISLVLFFVIYSIIQFNKSQDIGETVKINISEEVLKVNEACLDLGCYSNTIYVGSINSDKYYSCECRYAKSVKPENIICFEDGNDARSQGYVKSDC